MQLQNFGFLPFGYSPWGGGVPGVANPATGGSGGTSRDDSLSSSIGNALSSAVSGTLSSGATTNVSELAVVRESETLKIQMTDGTQVTIRVRAQGAAFGAAATQADGSSAAAAALYSSGQLQISVNGNLSAADQQAIGDVVSQVNSLASQFFSGDVQDAFAAAASLNIDPTEIAGFSMKLSYSSTLIQQASAAGTGSGADTPATAGTTPIGSAASQPISGTAASDTTSPASNTSASGASTASTPSASDASAPGTASTGASSGSTSSGATATDATSDTTPPGALAAGIATGTSATDANSSSPQQIIIKFLQQATAKLGRGSSSSHSQLSVASRWKLHLLAQALPAYAQAQAGTASQGTSTLQPAQLAADTLRQLAQ